MRRRLLFAVVIPLLLQHLWAQSSDEKRVIDSFDVYVHHHLDSYETNRRERVLLFPAGWVHQYYELDARGSKTDIQRTNSLLTPYVGTLEFRLIRHYTVFYKSREEAAADVHFVRVDVNVHRHTYAYQSEHWLPKERKFHIPEHDRSTVRARILLGQPVNDDYIEWFDCNGPIGTQRDIRGCLEEFDSVEP